MKKIIITQMLIFILFKSYAQLKMGVSLDNQLIINKSIETSQSKLVDSILVDMTGDLKSDLKFKIEKLYDGVILDYNHFVTVERQNDSIDLCWGLDAYYGRWMPKIYNDGDTAVCSNGAEPQYTYWADSASFPKSLFICNPSDYFQPCNYTDKYFYFKIKERRGIAYGWIKFSSSPEKFTLQEIAYSSGIISAVVPYFENYAIHFFPNPTKEKLTISLDKFENYLIRIFDVKGEVKISETGNGDMIEVSMNKLEKGVYIADVEIGGSHYKKKIIKE